MVTPLAGSYRSRMLAHRPWQRPLLLAGNLAAPAAVVATRFGEPWLLALAATLHAGFACAVAHPRCGWFGPVASRFETARRELWLTIDDGPVGDESVALGDALAARGVRATFFVKGENLARHPAVAPRWLAAGHTLANHTQTHPMGRFPWLSRRSVQREIDACHDALRRAGAPDSPWFRAPVGLKGVHLHPVLAKRGLRLVAWTERGKDGRVCDPDAVLARLRPRCRPGAILVLHEGQPRSREAILRVVEAAQTDGYAFTIPEDSTLR